MCNSINWAEVLGDHIQQSCSLRFSYVDIYWCALLHHTMRMYSFTSELTEEDSYTQILTCYCGLNLTALSKASWL